MAWAAVADVKAIIDTVEADAKIQSNLDIAKKQIEVQVGTQTGVIPDSLFIAHLYLTVVLFLRSQQYSGELAYFSKMADTQTYNQIEEGILQFTKMYQDAIRTYKNKSTSIGAAYIIVHNNVEIV